MISKSQKQTMEIASRFAASLKGEEKIFLYGDVGAGKTVFAKGLALGLGVTDTVVSPTYTYFNVYQSGKVPMYHFDLYRVKRAEDLTELGILESLEAKGIKVVEWAEILGKQEAILVTITKKGNEREILIENFGD